jgi:hypothetical protein
VKKGPIDLPILFKQSLSTVNYHHTMKKFDWLGAGILLIPIGKGLIKEKNAGVECFLLFFPRARKCYQRYSDSPVKRSGVRINCKQFKNIFFLKENHLKTFNKPRFTHAQNSNPSRGSVPIREKFKL